MASFPTSDLALRFDASRFACDLTIADGDLVVDATPVSAMLISLFTDRRADADDVLPTGVSPLAAPVSWDERRGWVGDCLDRAGRRIGSRLWLLDREHETEETRRAAEIHVVEAFAWVEGEYGLTPEIEVAWIAKNRLGLRVMIDGRAVSYVRKVA